MPTTTRSGRRLAATDEEQVQQPRPSTFKQPGREPAALQSPTFTSQQNDKFDASTSEFAVDPTNGADGNNDLMYDPLPYRSVSKQESSDNGASKQQLRQRNAVDTAREQTQLLKAKHKLPQSPPPQHAPRRPLPTHHTAKPSCFQPRPLYILPLLLPVVLYLLFTHPELLPTQLTSQSYFKQAHQALQRLSPTVDYKRVQRNLHNRQWVDELCNESPELCYSVATKLQPALLHRFDTVHRPHNSKHTAPDATLTLRNPLVILLVGPKEDITMTETPKIDQFVHSLSYKLYNTNSRRVDVDLSGGLYPAVAHADPKTFYSHAVNEHLTNELQRHFKVHDEGVVLLEHVEGYQRYHAEQLQLFLDDSGDAPYKHAIYCLSLHLPASEWQSLQLDDRSNQQLLDHADLKHIDQPVRAFTDKQYHQRVAAIRQHLRDKWKSEDGGVDDTLEPLLVRLVKNVLIVT